MIEAEVQFTTLINKWETQIQPYRSDRREITQTDSSTHFEIFSIAEIDLVINISGIEEADQTKIKR